MFYMVMVISWYHLLANFDITVGLRRPAEI